MKTLDLSPEAAENALVVLARHVGAGVEIGRPILATPAEDNDTVSVLVDLGPDTTAVWWITDHECSRLLPLAGGRLELTSFRNGREVSRRIGNE